MIPTLPFFKGSLRFPTHPQLHFDAGEGRPVQDNGCCSVETRSQPSSSFPDYSSPTILFPLLSSRGSCGWWMVGRDDTQSVLILPRFSCSQFLLFSLSNVHSPVSLSVVNSAEPQMPYPRTSQALPYTSAGAASQKASTDRSDPYLHSSLLSLSDSFSSPRFDAPLATTRQQRSLVSAVLPVPFLRYATD